ncbi:MAG: peptide deformylase [Pseudomonadota bacterium]
MSLREILRWPDPRLASPCEEVTVISGEIVELAQDMLETMYAAPGRGLAAPQVGVLSRVFVMDSAWKEAAPAPKVFINPEIVARSATQAVQAEGCLSIPGVTVELARPDSVVLRWTDLDGQTQEEAFSGFSAACVQHELDHLDGIVTLDRLEASDRADVIAAYEAQQS